MFFKIIEENNICLLDKNGLNFGFITSKSTYQYYYAEILQGEEGELMLHNKRLFGVLYANIIDKNDSINLNDTSLYPHEEDNVLLEYNEHKLQLKFSSISTAHCINGCYLLITYEQSKSIDNFPLIGYEYTILSRTWNCTDSVSKLIEIPPNEYIISSFDKLTSPNHYYFIHLPKDIDKIIIQLEGSYFEGYYEEGKKKINTWNGNYKELIDYAERRNVAVLNRANITQNYLSFAFIYDESNSLSFSFYYFRVLFAKENEVNYLPIDSNLGNLCKPEFNLETNRYYCNLILKNNYNELNSTKFAISSENQNEYVGINISIIDNNNLEIKNYNTNFTYVYDEIINDVNYILFTFEFNNNGTKNIISSFCDRIENIYPQVYSGQMFYLDNFTKINKFEMDEEYFLKYQFIYGDTGIFNYTINNIDYIKISKNFRRKPFIFPLDKNFSFSTNNTKHIFYYQLINNMIINDFIEEVKTGEPLTKLLNVYAFPLYFYIEIKNKNYLNIDVNIRFQKYMNYSEQSKKYKIKGYIINEESFEKIRDELPRVDYLIEGNYSDAFGIGFLHVNQKSNSTLNYLFIEISNLDESYSYQESLSIIEISSKEYVDENMEYMLPINKYIIESFEGQNGIRKENKYCIYKLNKNAKQVLLEISTEYDDIYIESNSSLIPYNKNEEEKKEKGFKKYLIDNTITGKINFKVKNEKLRKTNYLIKYSFYDIDDKKTFIFNDNDIKINNDFFTFKYIKVNTSSELLNNKGTYFYITGTLYKTSDTSDKEINSNYILNKKNSPYVNKTIHFYNSTSSNSWTLEFNGFPKEGNYSYDLQLQIHAFLQDNFLHEEYLLYKKEAIISNTIPYKPGFDNKIFIYIFTPIGAIIIGVALFFLIKYLRLRKKNEKFKKEIKSLLFSNGIQKNVLIEEKQLSKNESDYENTFI